MTLTEILPQIESIADADLKKKTVRCLDLALKRGGWIADDLEKIPFTLLIKECPVSLAQHTRAVTDLSLKAYAIFSQEYANYYTLNRDLLLAGALLHDVGKILEYKRENGEYSKSASGKILRHPFSGANLAAECGLPDEVVHIIAVHAHEGDAGYRTPEARIVNHADFMNFEPLRDLLK